MAAPTRDEIIGILQANVRAEHAAVIQYLQHAYRIGEGELASEIEGIAREEMRHYKWFSELVVSLGGDPTTQRGRIAVDGAAPPDLMLFNVEAERLAIRNYEQQLGIIDDPRIRMVLQRVISDEKAHLSDFESFLVELGGASPEAEDFVKNGPYSEGAFSPDGIMQVERLNQTTTPPQNPQDQTAVELVNQDISDEYAAILQYLHQAFLTPYCEVNKDLLEEIAIDEMKHAGWLSELVAELAGEPTTDYSEIKVAEDTAGGLRIDVEDERRAQKNYEEHAAAIESPDIRALLDRIRSQEGFHEQRLEMLIDQVVSGKMIEALGRQRFTGKSPLGRLTVGSLRGRRMAE